MSSENTESEVISKEFLENSLGRKVNSFTMKVGSEIGDNYMSILYALDVKVPSDKDNGKEDTLHLLSKCYPTNPTRQSFLNKSNIFWKELVAYTEWIPALQKLIDDMGLKDVKPGFAPFVSGSAINFAEEKEKNNNEVTTKVYRPFDIYIMMDDLRQTGGFKMANRLLGIDKDHVALAFSALAEIHALSWIYKQTNNLSRIVDKFPTLHMDFGDTEDRAMWESMTESSMKSTLDVIKASVGEDSVLYKATENYKVSAIALQSSEVFFNYGNLKERDLDKLMRIKPRQVDESEETSWQLVIHGDCWVNNMLFSYNPETGKPEKLVFVDLQMCRDGCPTVDLSYLVYVSTDAEFRKNHLDDMLKLYADKFTHICQLANTEPLPGFSFLELKRRFHRSKFFGLVMAIFCLPIMLKDKENVTDMETLKGDITELFTSMGETKGENSRYSKRLMEVIQELYDDGII